MRIYDYKAIDKTEVQNTVDKFRKIDIYTKRRFAPRGTRSVWGYECSTNRAKTCKEAKEKFCIRHCLSPDQVKTEFAK